LHSGEEREGKRLRKLWRIPWGLIIAEKKTTNRGEVKTSLRQGQEAGGCVLCPQSSHKTITDGKEYSRTHGRWPPRVQKKACNNKGRKKDRKGKRPAMAWMWARKKRKKSHVFETDKTGTQRQSYQRRT